MLIVAPLLTAVLVFLGGLVWYAYRLYREEYDKRMALEPKAAELQRLQGEKESLESALKELLSRLEERQAQITELNRVASKASRLHDVQEQLGRFVIEGQRLLQVCTSSQSPGPQEKVEEWVSQVEKFLSDILGVAYVARFHSEAGLLSSYFDKSVPHQILWRRVTTRLVRLEQFLAEISRQ